MSTTPPSANKPSTGLFEWVLTSEHSDYDGSDDEPFSSPSDDDSDPAELDNTSKPLLPKGKHLKPLVKKLIKVLQSLLSFLKRTDHHKAPDFIPEEKQVGLRRCDLGQANIPAPLTPEVQGSILSSHQRNEPEGDSRRYQETWVEVHTRTVQRYLKKLNLKLLPDDLSEGRVAMDQVYDAINDIRKIFYRVIQDTIK
ncbi:hypothetical protein KEM48_013087 [Puccinia striiformis f. sp. tritici PST-130]|nr:hypothetical protein KEM48_013087 [Puccinia striiformis f. sp. tritici PST-130]